LPERASAPELPMALGPGCANRDESHIPLASLGKVLSQTDLT